MCSTVNQCLFSSAAVDRYRAEGCGEVVPDRDLSGCNTHPLLSEHRHIGSDPLHTEPEQAIQRRHRDYINHQIAIDAVDPYELAGLMQEAKRQHPKAKPFKTRYDLEGSRQSMLERQPWHISPAIKIADDSVKRAAAQRMQQRHQTGESAKSIAKECGVRPGTVYEWEKQFTPENDSGPGEE
ncbi:hypothetical protein YERSI8AC_280157 [Enterobacterales bacterium 8AC]|nr:hypothetical protein YERSI8AC_280157 [Enterobacterales bacterium 8AC]